jgi:branched-chain amino acid transport system ATP-binding protein
VSASRARREPTLQRPGTPPAIELVDVRKAFGPTPIIRGVSLAIEAGTRQALIGPNGAGKSVLFNLITGKYPVSGGRIRLRGEDITGRRPYEVNRRGLSRSFQVTNIFPWLSVFENVRCGVLWSLGYRYSFWHRVNAAREVRERTETVLEQLNLTARRHVPAGLLSYAEQRALEIGITIAGGADVILLDEPTSGMSRSETEQVVQLIRQVTAGKTLLMVEHDMSVVFDLADRIAVLVYGEVIAHDTPARIRASAAVQEAYLGVPQGAG